MMRALPLIVAATVCVALAGCQGSIPMPLPTGTASPSATGGALPSEDDLATPSGSTVIGKLGDPCALLKKSEIEKALGVAVIGVARGKVESDGSQVCAWAMDASGSTAAALGAFVGTLPSGGFGDVVDGLGTSGAVFGVALQVVDPSDLSGGDDGGDPETPEGVTITKVSIGGGGVVIATPNGGAAVANDGIRTNLLLMDLIAGPSSADALQTLLTKAYDRL